METINTKAKLSALWLFILLNIIFHDIHQYALKSHLEMLLTGTYNGTMITDTIMLIGGFLVEVSIAMVLFSLLLDNSRTVRGRADIAGTERRATKRPGPFVSRLDPKYNRRW